MRPASCGLATMESYNGILCWTGRVVEADIGLRGAGSIVQEGVVDFDPEAIAARRHQERYGSALRQDQRPPGWGPSSSDLACR